MRRATALLAAAVLSLIAVGWGARGVQRRRAALPGPGLDRDRDAAGDPGARAAAELTPPRGAPVRARGRRPERRPRRRRGRPRGVRADRRRGARRRRHGPGGDRQASLAALDHHVAVLERRRVAGPGPGRRVDQRAHRAGDRPQRGRDPADRRRPERQRPGPAARWRRSPEPARPRSPRPTPKPEPTPRPHAEGSTARPGPAPDGGTRRRNGRADAEGPAGQADGAARETPPGNRAADALTPPAAPGGSGMDLLVLGPGPPTPTDPARPARRTSSGTARPPSCSTSARARSRGWRRRSSRARSTLVAISHLHPDHFIDLVPLRHYLRWQFHPARHVVRSSRRRGLAGRLDALHDEPGFSAAALDVATLDPGRPGRRGR